MRPSVIKVAAWGDRYAESLYENILPCLFAPGNLSALSAVSPTTLLIYSDASEVFWGRTLPGLTVMVMTLGELPEASDLPTNRKKLAWTDADSVRFAISHGADWFGFQADTIISDGFLPRVKELLGSHLAVAGAPIRTCTERFSIMAEHRRVFSAKSLRDMSVRAMHPVTFDYFVREPSRTIPADPHQFFFKTPDGFVARTWQPCPYGVSFEGLADIEDGSTIDCHLITRLPPDRVYFVKPTDEFYLTSLDTVIGIPRFGAFQVSVDGVVQSIRKFAKDERDLAAYAAALNQRYVYPYSIQINDGLDEEATVAAIQSAVRAP